MTATATRTQYDPAQARVERARKALAAGVFHIQRRGNEGNTLRWTLKNGGGREYTITYDRETQSFTCTCPDFQNRGEQVGTCKHIEAVKIWERQRRQSNGKTNGVNGSPKRDMNGAASVTQTTDPIWALVDALREQNEVLRQIEKALRRIDAAIAHGAGLV